MIAEIVKKAAPVLGVLPVDIKAPEIRQNLEPNLNIGAGLFLHLLNYVLLPSAELKSGDTDQNITHASAHSGRISAGGLFALPGAKLDGHDFITDAQEKGAQAILSDRESPVSAERDCAYLFTCRAVIMHILCGDISGTPRYAGRRDRHKWQNIDCGIYAPDLEACYLACRALVRWALPALLLNWPAAQPICTPAAESVCPVS